MTKRLAVPGHTVDAALKVVKNPASKERMDTESLSLEDAAIYAEFEDDPDALTRLVSRRTWQPLVHLAQELRDQRTERKAVVAEVKRLRQQGIPVIEPAEVPGGCGLSGVAGAARRGRAGGALPAVAGRRRGRRCRGGAVVHRRGRRRR